jgi:Phytanoyl-CoA dioxygenase (PhyH)
MPDSGFSIFEGVLSRQECNSLAGPVCGMRLRRAGARNLMSDPTVSSLACDSSMLRLAADILGPGAVPFRATLFDKSIVSNWHVSWHQDRSLPLLNRIESSEWGPWSTKAGVLCALAPAWALERIVALRIHLDASNQRNGPLRVIPGSHKQGVMSPAQVLQALNSVRPITCIVGNGGVLAMRPLLLHSSSKATTGEPRRVLHIEYAIGLDLAPGVRLRIA